MKPLCALVIGHKGASPGASSRDGRLTEFEFNESLAMLIAGSSIVDIVRVHRRTWADLPDDINDLNPNFIVSLHCNSFPEPPGVEEASGSEVLYYHRSTVGHHLAELVLGRIVGVLGLPIRGVKPVDAEGRGGHLLNGTEAPCVIAEPFFIDNDSDLKIAQARFPELADAYCGAIEAFGEGLMREDVVEV